MVVHPVSHGVSRVPRYSGSQLTAFSFGYGALTLCGRPSHDPSPKLYCRCAGPQPRRINPPVWPLPRSLATTCGISVDVSSSPYLDVSVQAVPFLRLFDSTQDDGVLLRRVAPFGNPRIDGYLLLPEAYRSLSRPSSAPDAKAFPLRSFQLDLSNVPLIVRFSGELCRLYKDFDLIVCYPAPFRMLFHNQICFLSVSCKTSLLPYFRFLSHCSVFKVQISRPLLKSDRLEHSSFISKLLRFPSGSKPTSIWYVSH